MLNCSPYFLHDRQEVVLIRSQNDNATYRNDPRFQHKVVDLNPEDT